VQGESRRRVIADKSFFAAFAGAFDEPEIIIRFLTNDGVIAAFAS
jgi:hypothetical protein